MVEYFYLTLVEICPFLELCRLRQLGSRLFYIRDREIGPFLNINGILFLFDTCGNRSFFNCWLKQLNTRTILKKKHTNAKRTFLHKGICANRSFFCEFLFFSPINIYTPFISRAPKENPFRQLRMKVVLNNIHSLFLI